MSEIGWIIAFLKIMFYLPLIGLIGTIFHESIPKCFGSLSKAWSTVRCDFWALHARHMACLALHALGLMRVHS